jgi:hypothetical protein
MRRFPWVVVAFVLFAGLLQVYSTPNATAASTVVWTSTADFDGGDKGDPGPIWFAAGGINQARNYINDPSSVHVNGRTYIAWQGDSTYAPYITYYDHAAGTWETPVRVRNDNPLNQTADGHGPPAIAISSTGTIVVFCCAHSSPLLVSRNTAAWDISAWTKLTNFTLPFASIAYPHPVYVGTTLYLFYRYSGGWGPWYYDTSTNDGTSWGAPTLWIADNAYAGPGDFTGTRLWFNWANYTGGAQERRNLYVGYVNFADLHVYCKASPSDTDLGVTVSQAEADASCKVEDTGASSSDFGRVHVDASGTPYVLYVTGTSTLTTDWNYRFSYWTGAAWSAPVSVRSMDYWQSYGDFIVYSSSKLEAFVLSPGFTTSTSGPEGGHLEDWTWDGATWSSNTTILSQQRSGDKMNAPIVPVDFDDDIKVVWNTRWAVNGLQAHDRLYAWGGGGFVPNPALGSEFGVETSTDDAMVPTGQFGLASGKGDTFSESDSDANTTRWNGFSRSALRCAIDDITGGVLRTLITNGGSSECGVSSTFPISGNWDVRVKADTIAAGSNWQRDLCVYSIPGECSNTAGALLATQHGFFYRDLTPNVFSAFNVSGGTVTQVGTNTAHTADPIWLRIARSSNTFTFYYSDDGSAWTQDEQFVRGDAPSTYYVSIVSVVNGVTDGQVDFDDYTLAAGTVDAPGYRASGSWTSPVFQAGKLEGITLAHSGLSGTAYIDAVEVLDAGAVVETFPTDITSGTSTSLTPAIALRETPQIRVTLAGNGAGTPVLESIEVAVDTGGLGYLSRRPVPGWSADPGLWGCTVRFTDTSSQNDSNPIVERRWDFGDGETSRERNPEHTYRGCPMLRGSYRVELEITLSDHQKWYAIKPMEYDRLPLLIVTLIAVLAAAVYGLARIRQAELRAISRILGR